MRQASQAEPAAQDKECRKPRYHEGDMVWYVHTPELKYEATIKEVIISYAEVVYLIRIDGENKGYLRVLEDSLAPRGIDAAVAKVENPDGGQEARQELVNHPEHYNLGGIECIDGILAARGPEATKEFCICNAMKYLWRLGHKDDAVQEAKKARWYLDKFIELCQQ